MATMDAPAAEPRAVRVIPTWNDIVLGRGGQTNLWPSQSPYLEIVRRHVFEYHDAPRAKKGEVVDSIRQEIKRLLPPGRFLKQTSDGVWHQVEETKALNKIKQCLRDRYPEVVKQAASVTIKNTLRKYIRQMRAVPAKNAPPRAVDNNQDNELMAASLSSSLTKDFSKMEFSLQHLSLGSVNLGQASQETPEGNDGYVQPRGGEEAGAPRVGNQDDELMEASLFSGWTGDGLLSLSSERHASQETKEGDGNAQLPFGTAGKEAENGKETETAWSFETLRSDDLMRFASHHEITASSTAAISPAVPHVHFPETETMKRSESDTTLYEN